MWWEGNIKDWSLANLSQQLKIEYGGDASLRRHLWCPNDYQG